MDEKEEAQSTLSIVGISRTLSLCDLTGAGRAKAEFNVALSPGGGLKASYTSQNPL